MASRYSREDVLQLLDDEDEFDEILMEGSDVEFEIDTDLRQV